MPKTPRPSAPPSVAERLLTEAELELMRILWQAQEGTVRDVLDQLPPERDLAYTTVSTTLRILESKGFVASRKEGRSHVYTPTEPKPRYEARSLRHMLGSLFGGDRLALVRQLIDSEPVPDDELRALQALLDDKLGDAE